MKHTLPIVPCLNILDHLFYFGVRPPVEFGRMGYCDRCRHIGTKNGRTERRFLFLAAGAMPQRTGKMAVAGNILKWDGYWVVNQNNISQPDMFFTVM